MKIIEQLVEYLAARDLLAPERIAALRALGLYGPPLTDEEEASDELPAFEDDWGEPRGPGWAPYDEYAYGEDVARALARRRPALARQKRNGPYRKRPR